MGRLQQQAEFGFINRFQQVIQSAVFEGRPDQLKFVEAAEDHLFDRRIPGGQLFNKLIISAVFLYVGNIGAENKIPNLELKDFEIAGYHLTQPIPEIVSKLGPPIKTEYNKKLKFNMYYYSKFAIGFYNCEMTLNYIIIEDPQVKTFRGIGIGDQKEQIFQKYGEEKLQEGNEYIYELWHPSYDWGPYSISFVMKNGIVAKIIIYFAAD